MTDRESLPPALRANISDRSLGVLRALSSAVPVAGPFIAELAGELVPGQRIDRMAEFLHRLAHRVADQGRSIDEIRDGLDWPRLALYMDGATAAARATSNERIDQIAKLVADGMTEAEADALGQARLLRLFSEIDDEEVLTLLGLSDRYSNDPSWRARHPKLTAPVTVRDQESKDKSVLFNLRNQRLVQLHLATAAAGQFEGTMRITASGTLLLKRLGLV